jgi:uncharacterized RDD family membrane protein YckC
MHCQHCSFINGEDDHRCLRCGRRLTGIVIAAPTSYIGANALAMKPEPYAVGDPKMSYAPGQSPEQSPLFQASQTATVSDTPRATPKVIPFEKLQRHAAGKVAPQAQPEGSPKDVPERKLPAHSRAPQRKAVSPVGQGSLDFRPGVPQGERILATGVPAQVYGDGRVAPPMRRLTAGAMDVTMVLLGFGAFAGGVRLAGSFLGGVEGSGFGAGKAVWFTLALSLLLISAFYGLVWALARRETAGMNWTQLQLVTFDGSPLDGRNRAIRFAAAWLSYSSGGLGLLWALADAENLAFHDHISKTYPAEKTSSSVLVRPR